MCDSPYTVANPTPWDGRGQKLPVPCGRCPVCKKRRVSQWVFRLEEESKLHKDAHFVTLTYERCPETDSGLLTLDRKEFPAFMKRLRSKVYHKGFRNKIRYYAVGEYGSEGERPHYHAIIFGCPDPVLYEASWRQGETSIGIVHVGTVTAKSIAYCAQYVDKKKIVPKFDGDDRVPEFSLMSKGIGKNYLTDAKVAYHKSDLSRMYVTRKDGVKVSMPKYYKDKIFDDLEKMKMGLIAKRKFREDLEFDEKLFDGDAEEFFARKEQERFARYENFYLRQKTKKRNDL